MKTKADRTIVLPFSIPPIILLPLHPSLYFGFIPGFARSPVSGARTAEIARSFWTNEEMGGSLRLDGVVCVVDSRNVLKVRRPSLSPTRDRDGHREPALEIDRVCSRPGTFHSNWKKGKNVKSEPLFVQGPRVESGCKGKGPDINLTWTA